MTPVCLQLRERDWANVITAHEGNTAAYTWRLNHLTLGEHVLRPPKKKAKASNLAPLVPKFPVNVGSLLALSFLFFHLLLSV